MAEDLMRKTLLALVALAACTDNGTGTGDDDTGSGSGSGSGEVSAADRQRDYDDVAVSLGAYVSGDLTAMVDSVNMAYGRMPEGFTLTQGTDYVLLSGNRGSLDIKYKLYCRDDADLLTACNGAENHAHVRPT